MNVDLLTINAHKIHGPKGVGALYIRKGLVLEPILHGGGQERGLRSSTENVAGIAAFTKAAEIACNTMHEETERISLLQQKIIRAMENEFEGIYFNGSLSDRIPHNVNFCIDGLEGEGIRLQLLLDEAGVCVSTGSACSSNTGSNPSHVLQAIGLNPFQARGGIRITLGRFTTEEEVERFLVILKEKVMQLKPIF
jgi:cysteine desulfurase